MIFMKDRYSHCMNKVRSILILCLMLGCQALSHAQRYEDVVKRNFWNDSENIAGIRLDSLSCSYAEVYGGYEGGGFRDTWQPEDSWNAGAVTASIMHFDRMSLKGAFSFEQNEGYGMCGSMFIDPGYYPIDVLEFTPGRKTLQTYYFDGGISYELSRRWFIGARMDFESSNISKRKDLRHTNWKLDMKVAPGLMYSNGNLSAGVSPIFRKTSETIDAEQIGISESSYSAFLDKGLMYGIYQVWTGSGIHLDELGVNGLPVKENSYGAAAQIQYRDAYLDFEFLSSRGSVGEKEYIWFEFPGMSVASDFRYGFAEGRQTHYLRMGFDWNLQNLDENVLEKVNVNGVNSVIPHGSNRIFSREQLALNAGYEYVSDRLETNVEFGWDMQKGLASQIYPYVNARNMSRIHAQLGMVFHLGKFDLSMECGCSEGDMEEEQRTVSDEVSLTAPYRLQDWYDRQMEYMTAGRINGAVSVRYNFLKGIYIQADTGWIHALDLDYITGADRFAASLKIGYTF